MGHVRALDGVRGLAILLVLLFHSGLLDAGWIGVNLFFVLSGFLISRVLQKSQEQKFSLYIKRFWWRRALRIFPLYYGFLLVVYLVYLWLGLPKGTMRDMPYALSYTINYRGLFVFDNEGDFFNYLWSLGVEEQFYLFWPLLFYFISPRNLRIFAIGILAASPILRWGLGEYWISNHGTAHGVGGSIYVMSITRLDEFMVGALLALGANKIKLSWIKPAFWVVSGIGLSYMVYYYFIVYEAQKPWFSLGFPIATWQGKQYILGYSIAAIFLGTLMLMVLRNSYAGLNRFFTRPWIVFIGKVSYGIYIFHLPLQGVMLQIYPLPKTYFGRMLYFIPFTLLSVGIAWLSYHFFEKWFLKMKDKYFALDSVSK